MKSQFEARVGIIRLRWIDVMVTELLLLIGAIASYLLGKPYWGFVVLILLCGIAEYAIRSDAKKLGVYEW